MIEKKNRFFLNNQGQALLPLLVLLLIVLTLGVGMLHLNIGGLLLSSQSLTGETVLLAAEGALENGLLLKLRNPPYSGESLQVNNIPCTINVSGAAPIVMTAECDNGRAIRRLQAEISFIQGEMIVDNLREVE